MEKQTQMWTTQLLRDEGNVENSSKFDIMTFELYIYITGGVPPTIRAYKAWA